jgi:hypothetical protein
MPSRLSDCLVATGLAPAADVRAAIARQAVYGGALDTALLEMGTLDEPTLWEALGRATGLPLPPAPLYETPTRYETPAGAPVKLDAAWSERCRAVAVGFEAGAVQILCGEPVARADIDGAAAVLGLPFALFVVPEVRLAAVRQAVFERPMTTRLVRLFARIAGTQPVRRWQAAQVKPLPAAPLAGIEILPPGTRPPASAPAPAAAAPTAAAPAELGPAELGPAEPGPASNRAPPKPAPVLPRAGRIDPREFAALVARLKVPGPEAAGAEKALEALTKQDLGGKPRRWEAWWKKHKDEERVEWLFAGLSHKTIEIRASAEEELRALTGQYFGYHFDLPKLEREQARVRWQAWWYESAATRRK